jgi:hypothetical protein
MPALEQAEIDWSLDEDTQRELQRYLEEEPVGNIYAPRLLRMLLLGLFSSYVPPPNPSRRGEKRPFWADYDVGFVHERRIQAPDLFLSLDVEPPDNPRVVAQLYKLSVAKPPELFVEVVSQTPGGELERKLEVYASWGIQYYLVFDWVGWLGEALAIHAFSLENGRYVRLGTPYFPKIGLGVRLWTGRFEGRAEQTYLRFHDENGELLLTDGEKKELSDRRADEAAARSERYRTQADREHIRAERERIRAEQSEARAEQERARAQQSETRAEQSEARADAEAEARQRAEAQVRELLQRLADTTRES